MVAGILLCACKAGHRGLRPLGKTDSSGQALLILTLPFTEIIPLAPTWSVKWLLETPAFSLPALLSTLLEGALIKFPAAFRKRGHD